MTLLDDRRSAGAVRLVCRRAMRTLAALSMMARARLPLVFATASLKWLMMPSFHLQCLVVSYTTRLRHTSAGPRVQQTQRRGLGLQAVWVGCHVRRKREEEGAGGPNQGVPSLLLDGDEDDEHGLGERESVHVGQVAGGRHHVDEHDLVHIDREYDRERDGEPRVDGVPCEEEGQK